jgi:two-component system, chemotaxis family, sensor kinase Cph1
VIPDLDGLDPAALSGLEFGVFQVDAAGVVRLCARPETVASDLSAAAATGLDFFRELAPGTNVPAFRGRVIAALRRGDGERFPFVFAGETRAVRAEIELIASRQPGLTWIVVRPVEALPPARVGEALAAVGAHSRAEPVDPLACEREPIHVPGLIQPDGVLLAADPDLRIQLASANCAEVLEAGPAQVAGRALDDALPADLVAAIRARLARGALRPEAPLRRRVDLGAPPAPHLVSVHAHDGRVLIEIERLADRPEDFGACDPTRIEEAVMALRGAGNLSGVAWAAAREVRAMTGFERVLVYRFDQDWNGEALAEARAPDWEQSLLGLRFPASDIPAQARALYTRSRSRFVVDRDARPVPLVAALDAGNRPVDLTFAGSRSLSPIHLEYQRNLGVNGSMSASILVEGRLWGLVIGHHRRPHYLAPETRAAVAVIADTLGSRIHEIEAHARFDAQQADLRAQFRLVERMAGSDDFVAALTEGDETLLDLFDATGAAVVGARRTVTVGRVPEPRALAALVEWLRGRDDGGRTLATDHLGGLYPPALEDRATASGLLATGVGADRREWLIWFRAEVASTIVWGGDPRKPVLAGAGATVLPRRSFERWIEERAGYAAPWAPWQAEIARSLAGAVAGVVRRQSRRVAELTAKQDDLVAVLADKERLLEQKDVLSREIDHRVRNSLQIVASFLQMQGRTIKDPAARRAFSDTYGRVMSVARVHDSLYQSESMQEVDLGQTIERLCNDLAGMAGDKRGLELEAHAGLMVPYRTAVGLALVATELVTNALKYAYPAEEIGDVRVVVTPQVDGAGVCLTVSDHGRGLPEDWATATRPGSGLGMRLIRAMLQQIGGTMTVEKGEPQGARFVVCT